MTEEQDFICVHEDDESTGGYNRAEWFCVNVETTETGVVEQSCCVKL